MTYNNKLIAKVMIFFGLRKCFGTLMVFGGIRFAGPHLLSARIFLKRNRIKKI
jgi:hypothetical protein